MALTWICVSQPPKTFWYRFAGFESLPFLHPNGVSDNRQSVKSRQPSVGRKRFPSSLKVVCSFTDMLVSTEKFSAVKKEKKRKGVCGGKTEGPGMEERGKQVSYALMIQWGLPHCIEYLTGR